MTSETPAQPDEKLPAEGGELSGNAPADHASLKYSLLGPSLTKAGQDSVDQSKACSSHRVCGTDSVLTETSPLITGL
jgi:DNA polymerase kappa